MIMNGFQKLISDDEGGFFQPSIPLPLISFPLPLLCGAGIGLHPKEQLLLTRTFIFKVRSLI